MLEEEEDENFELYLSDDEKIKIPVPDNDSLENGLNTVTHEEFCESPRLQITERTLIHDLPTYNEKQARSQTRNKNIHQGKSLQQSQENEDEIEEIKDRKDPQDKENDTENDVSSEGEKSRIKI